MGASNFPHYIGLTLFSILCLIDSDVNRPYFLYRVKKSLLDVHGASKKDTFGFGHFRNKSILRKGSNPLTLWIRNRPESKYGMKVEEVHMMSESARRSNFKDTISPYLEVLLQLSLWRTRNGRDAAELMRKAMAEAYRSWDESMPEESCNIWLNEILTRRFFDGFQHSHPHVPIFGNKNDETIVRNNPLFETAATNSELQPFATGGPDEDVNYFKAIASLPAMCRPVMILSYLEGHSKKENADLPGDQSRATKQFFYRGRKFIQEELFAHLMGKDSPDIFADRGKVQKR
jgi:DNA-directed RNA polymerase specialized sigma24 family protein